MNLNLFSAGKSPERSECFAGQIDYIRSESPETRVHRGCTVQMPIQSNQLLLSMNNVPYVSQLDNVHLN